MPTLSGMLVVAGRDEGLTDGQPLYAILGRTVLAAAPEILPTQWCDGLRGRSRTGTTALAQRSTACADTTPAFPGMPILRLVDPLSSRVFGLVQSVVAFSRPWVHSPRYWRAETHRLAGGSGRATT